MLRGDICYVYLDPVFGHELGGYKMRPVVVVSIDALNKNTGVVTVVPGTSTPSSYPNVVRVEGTRDNGLREPTYFQCHQARSIDKGRMVGTRYRLSRHDFDRVEETLWKVLGWIPEVSN